MKGEDVEIGGIYTVRVSGRFTEVRIDRSAPDVHTARGGWRSGGWIGTNVRTNRTVRIRSAQRLRRRVDA